MKALVAILSTFPVILFKILPELKPSNRNKEQSGVITFCLITSNIIYWICSCCTTREKIMMEIHFGIKGSLCSG